MMENGTLNPMDHKNLKLLGLKMLAATGRHFQKPLNYYISATVWLILMKFVTIIDDDDDFVSLGRCEHTINV